MNHNPTIEPLTWDSRFFSCKVARLFCTVHQFSAGLQKAKEHSAHLLYWDNLYEIKEYNCLASRISYRLSCKGHRTLDLDSRVYNYNGQHPTDKMIALSILSGHCSRFKKDPRIPERQFEELFTQWIRNSVDVKSSCDVLVAKVNGEIAGLITIDFQEKSSAKIGLLSIDPLYRRQKLGFSLLNAALNLANRKNITTIEVVTQGENIAACKLYEAFGFVIAEKSYSYHFWLDK